MDVQDISEAKAQSDVPPTTTLVPTAGASSTSDDEFPSPTEEELAALVRVSGKIPWTAYTIAFVELCERFSYYGTTAVFVNFIQRPLPEGSNTGAGFEGQSGALGMGQRASTGLTTCKSTIISASEAPLLLRMQICLLITGISNFNSQSILGIPDAFVGRIHG
jgi:POT family proton-dependent oligopeptide transporter